MVYQHFEDVRQVFLGKQMLDDRLALSGTKHGSRRQMCDLGNPQYISGSVPVVLGLAGNP